ncbi:MAG TPA: tetratricopeptide repeat protein [Rhizomicrobium sp.]
MSDIFQEVEEEVRRERLEQIWKDYGDYIVAGICLLVIGAAGLQLWRTYDHNQRLKASDEYVAAEQLIEGGQTKAAADAFGRLADSAPGGYKILARLQHANALLYQGQREDALTIYKQIAQGDDPLLGAVARVRAAWVEADYLPRSEVETTLGVLASDATNPWHGYAEEILAYSDYRNNATGQALGEYQAMLKDPKTPQAIRERVGIMVDFLKAGGEANYGTVPAPPPAPKAPDVIDPNLPQPAPAPAPAPSTGQP